MDKQKIINQESGNDGQSVFLYFDPITGKHLAFGLSAYYADMITTAPLSFSEEMQMPVIILGRREMLDLLQSMPIKDHNDNKYYHLQTRQYIGEAGYKLWSNDIRNHGE